MYKINFLVIFLYIFMFVMKLYPNNTDTNIDSFEYVFNVQKNYIVISRYIGKEMKVTIPEKIDGCPVGEIGEYCFFGNSYIKSVILPDSIVIINNNAFRNSSLTKIVLSNSLRYIGDSVFCDTPLKSIILPDGLEYIGEYAFYNTAITRLIIPDSVKKIDWWAFGNCEKLEYIKLSKSLDQIPSRFCENCINLKDIENIGFCPVQSTAFVGCRKLPITVRKKLIDAGYGNNF
ncbi:MULTISPECIES: leucine-rich repeat domain-containing protein [Treponema]|uniref:Surface protein, putative n=1 Tax=Treponema denticola (strain ATCC 35405 / DSM 14222 / CIP 103919 / JCM 8153 / KCTC 15104) TaxID=243275 RepID=Q73JP0_TREDE|nr:MULTISPECIES: leucine-rich repeat domain-containing protein [Treponema]AAS12960.1 surface protein, putative [Treponema denticola ATCC 35405]EMB38092.1 hypothetical protein HMPREF9721_01109 [Treponema denticola ATCC 35404]EMB40056.1 hypothetical protein HMPREF9735_00720 [Treponema denticola ATCC 33521]UTC86933.1 leucine-rich repeat domain-containing protein [Treponema denticola]UTC94503.1 leucine-rich repeat domain-containing protein [Treponema denticola]